MFQRKKNTDYRASNSHFNFIKDGEEMMIVCHISVFAESEPHEIFKLEAEETYIARLHKDNFADQLDIFRDVVNDLGNDSISNALDEFVQKFQPSYKPN